MIVQGTDGGLLLFSQTEHAHLSGAFAAAWTLGPLPNRDSVLIAAYRHDDGWIEWELAPTLDGSGRPVDFIGIPAPSHVELYRRGIDLVEDADPYAGCAVSMHGERLYTRAFHPGMRPRIEHLRDGALAAATAFVAHEQARQRRLVDQHGFDAAALEELWRLLQVWDRLSLFVCMAPLGTGGSATMPPVRVHDGGDAAIRITSCEAGEVRLDPYPFAEPGTEFSVEARFVPAETFEDVHAYRRAYRGAERRSMPFVARPSEAEPLDCPHGP